MMLKNCHTGINIFNDTVDSGPTHIWIDPTTRCNNRCIHCYHYYQDFGEDMDESIYHKISESVLSGVKRVDLVGYGEPFLAKQFDKIFDDCIQLGLEISTITNGIPLLNDVLLSKIVRSKMQLCLSIDGARKETFEFVRPFFKWEKMIEILERIKQFSEIAREKKRFQLWINFVAMKKNIADLPDMVRLAAKYGATGIYVLPLGDEDFFEKVRGQGLQDSPELVSPPYLKALKLSARLGVDLTVPPFFVPLILQGKERGGGIKGEILFILRKTKFGFRSLRRRGVSGTLNKVFGGIGQKGKTGVLFCTVPWNDSYFASDGTVYPCCVLEESMGNLNMQEFKDIWNGPLYKSLRRTVHSWNPTSICRYCHLSTGINGGDEKLYEKYFSKFRREEIPLNSEKIIFGDGCYVLEMKPDGSISHRWLGRCARISLPMKKGAKFLRFLILPRTPVKSLNPGKCKINGGSPEHFDNSCPDINFPIYHIKGEKIELELEMENVSKVGNDPRELSIPIVGIQYLF